MADPLSAGAGSPGAEPPEPRRLGLRSRFVIAIAGLIALVLAGNTYLLVIDARQERRRLVEQRTLSFAKLAVGPLCTAYEVYFSSGQSKFREIVHGFESLNPEIDRLALYDVTGRLLFDSRTLDRTGGDAASEAADGELLEAIRLLDESERVVRGRDGRELYRVVVPHVEEWGRHRFTLVAETSFAGLRGAIRSAAARIGFWAALVFSLGIALAVALARLSLRPLELLRRGALDLAEGRLDRRIGLVSGDEFESLAQAFDTMAERLQRSIADLEASNAALSAANQELTELDRLKSDLLANVSHELRTPLTAVQGYSEALSAGLLGPVSSEQKSALEVVQRNLRRLLAMIEELLASAHLHQGTLTVLPAPFDLAALVAEEVASLAAAGHAASPVQVDAEPEMPLVYADRDRIAQVLVNLIDNALKFTPPDGEVRVALRRRGAEVAVEVADTGIGMPPELVGRVFDRFYQVDPSTKRRYGGLGLGLAIVRDILAAHAVAIEVEREVGRGSAFRFALPLAEADAASGRRPRGLVVDASPRFLAAAVTALREAGVAPEAVQTVAAARERLRGGPAVVVLSRLLGDGDAFELLRDPSALGRARVVLRARSRELRLAGSLGAAAVIADDAPLSELVRATLRLAGGSAVESG